MLTITVRNFRGIKDAVVQVAPIALVMGRNRAGKSSLCQAVGAALSGRVIPVEGVLKSTVGVLVRSGADTASVQVATENDTAAIAYPAAERLTTGHLDASEFAVGFRSITDLPVKERAAALTAYLRSSPSQDDLNRALAEGGITAEASAAVWKAITQSGWDVAHKIAKDTGIRQKGAWEATTHDNYGSRKAQSWLPQEWHEDLASASLDTLESRVATAKALLEDNIAQQAVDQSGLEDLKDRAAKCPEASGAVDQARVELDAANAAKQQLPGTPDQDVDWSNETECPLCGGTVYFTLEGDAIHLHAEAPATEAPAVVDARQTAIREADVLIDTAREAVYDAERTYRDAEMAREALKDRDQGTGGTMTPEDIEKAREGVRIADQRLDAFKRKADADRYARAIASNAVIAQVISPDGLLKTILAQAIEGFNKDYLARFCEFAKWPDMKLEADLSITIGGRVFGLCSESEQYRARIVMQLALAKIDQAPLVVIDRADTLDQNGRNELFVLLYMVQIPALVAMTMNRIEKVPDLATSGIGRSYWLEDGVCTALVTDKAA